MSASSEILTIHLPYQLIGMAVVIVALAGLCFLCALAGWFFARRDRRAAAPPLPAPAPPSIPSEPPANDPRLLAAIAAAVSVALEEHAHTIVDIAPAAKINPMTSAWAMEGRFQHFSSHKFR
jgi:Na+-transporting methylmalonyl-CoA/oxaloacetate decarboxylase gamma subunit